MRKVALLDAFDAYQCRSLSWCRNFEQTKGRHPIGCARRSLCAHSSSSKAIWRCLLEYIHSRRWAFIVYHGDILEPDGQDGIIWGLIWHYDFYFYKYKTFILLVTIQLVKRCDEPQFVLCVIGGAKSVCQLTATVPSVHYCMMHYSCSGDGWYEERRLCVIYPLSQE